MNARDVVEARIRWRIAFCPICHMEVPHRGCEIVCARCSDEERGYFERREVR